jgi:paraquat-inducible protein A
MGSSASLIACEGCDLLHRCDATRRGQKASCQRCGTELDLGCTGAHHRVVPLALAGLVLLVVANTAPLMSFRVGQLQELELVSSGPLELAEQGFHVLAVLVALTTLVVPTLRLASLLWVMLALQRGVELAGTRLALRLLRWLREWSMLDIFLLGAIVAWIKLSDIAMVAMESGFWACAALVLVSSAAMSAFDPRGAWDALEPPE